MSALLKMDMYQAVAEAAVLKKSAGWVPELIVTADIPGAKLVAEDQKMGAAKSIALFLASPFIGLAYIIAMPFVAAAMLACYAAKALAARTPASVKKVAMIIAAPFIGLGFILALPIVGVSALGYFALKAPASV